MVAMLLAAVVAVAPQSAEALFRASNERHLRALEPRLASAAGSAPQDCGRFLITGFNTPPVPASTLREALVCLKTSAATGTAATILVQRQGDDSWLADGLIATTLGAVLQFSYDSDPSGGSGATPRFIKGGCTDPGVDDRLATWPTFICQP